MTLKNAEARRAYQREWARRNRASHGDAERERQRAYYHEHKETTREKRNERARIYGRRGLAPTRPCPALCEMCGQPPGKKALSLDHDHSTGVFRGWLCGRCNTALGLLRDSVDLCLAAARYLRKPELQ
jgi:hypothetical protein